VLLGHRPKQLRKHFKLSGLTAADAHWLRGLGLFHAITGLFHLLKNASGYTKQLSAGSGD
jgi:hypothetical protein